MVAVLGRAVVRGREWVPAAGPAEAPPSLYGDYWVDRPPLLLGLFWLAGHAAPLGHTGSGRTAPAVKLLGAAASSLTVVLAAVIAQSLAPTSRWTRHLAVLSTVALLSSPLLGMPEMNGELLALPFVLSGVVALVAATRRPWGRGTAFLSATAGAAGMSAALVKQNVVDVFVFAAVLLLGSARRQPPEWRWSARVRLVAAGGLAAIGSALAGAGVLGTTPTGLWNALVVFRLEAAGIIDASASSATTDRMAALARAALTSGVAPLLTLLLAGATLHHLRMHRITVSRSPLGAEAEAARLRPVRREETAGEGRAREMGVLGAVRHGSCSVVLWIRSEGISLMWSRWPAIRWCRAACLRAWLSIGGGCSPRRCSPICSRRAGVARR